MRPYPYGDVVHEIVLARARDRRSAPAVSCGADRLTYGELVDRSSIVAEALRERGVARGSFVGVQMPRGVDLAVVLLGVLRAGGAYIALDDAWPSSRRLRMLELAGAPVLVATGSELAEFDGRRVSPGALEASRQPLRAEVPVGGTDPFSVFATSGSTGEPKGVAIAHRGLVRTLVESGFPGFDSGMVMLQAAPLPWDMFAYELWVGLLNGGRVVLAPDRHVTVPGLRRFVTDEGVNTVYLTASLLNALVDEDPGCLAGVRTLVTGGERVSVPHVRKLVEAHPDMTVVNGYGPVEGTCATSIHVVRAEDVAPDSQEIPIGRPIRNTTVYVLETLEPGRARRVGAGDVGELYIGGDGLAIGYLDGAADVAARFGDVEVDGSVQRLYRTGDLVRQLPDGSLSFVGRADRQVKIRGHRVEPGEVEATLRRLDQIVDAVVVPVHDEATGRATGLAAYCTTPGRRPLDRDALVDALGRQIPDYMRPEWVVELGELPLKPSGKADRSRLPRPDDGDRLVARRSRAVAEVAAPAADDVPQRIAAVMADVLGLPVAPDADFLALGGDSLAATRVAGRLWDLLGTEVVVTDVIDAPTPRLLAARLADGDRDGPALPTVAPEVSWPAPASDAQLGLWLFEQFVPRTSANVVESLHEIDVAIDPATLRAALGDLIAAQEVLRTGYFEEDGELLQSLGEVPERAPLAVVDSFEPHELLDQAVAFIDLEAGAPLGAALATDGRRSRLAIAVHHIATDAWSELYMLEALSALYDQRAAGRPGGVDPAPGYALYALWHRTLLEQVGDAQRRYWRHRLAETPPLRWSVRKPASDGEELARHPVSVSPASSAAATRLAAELGTTPYAVLLSTFASAIRDEAEQDDFAVSVAVSGRRHATFEQTMGCFVNTLPVRLQLGGASDVRSAVRVGGTSLHGALRHQDLPFTQMLRTADVRRDVTTLIAQAGFLLQPRTADRLRLAGVSARRLPPQTIGGPPLDLCLELWTPARSDLPLEGDLIFRPEVVGDAGPAVARRFEDIARKLEST
jgi:amino acid adenylation domain-containing protein